MTTARYVARGNPVLWTVMFSTVTLENESTVCALTQTLALLLADVMFLDVMLRVQTTDSSLMSLASTSQPGIMLKIVEALTPQMLKVGV